MSVLTTERLILRPPRGADIGAFLPLIADYDVAKNLCRVPHPYTEDDACAFMTFADSGWRTGEDLPFAILRRADNAYLGTGGVHPARGFEFGYWLGKPFWGRGYATEAGAALIGYAFGTLAATRVIAGWFHDNPASGRVLEKLGLMRVGEEPRASLARGASVLTILMALDRNGLGTRKNAP